MFSTRPKRPLKKTHTNKHSLSLSHNAPRNTTQQPQQPQQTQEHPPNPARTHNAHLRGDLGVVADLGVEARADGGAALREAVQRRQRAAHAADAVLHLFLRAWCVCVRESAVF
jgi:hypothetical protein